MTTKTPAELEETLAILARDKVTAVIRTNCTERARQAAEAVIRGGFTSVEFTLSIPNALQLITEFSRKPGILVGVGTVLSPLQAEDGVRAGADYVVCPALELPVVKWCVERNVVCMAGVYTPTEMWESYKAGAHVAKLFPGAAAGPAFVKAVKGPMPFLRVVPTTGATMENCAEFMSVGAFGIGFTGVLLTPEDMASQNWTAIEQRAREMSAKTRGAPTPKL